MNCLKCDREVVEQAKFCSYCGEQIALECPSCKALNPPDGLFCHDCGGSLTSSKTEPPEPAPSVPRQPNSAPSAPSSPRLGGLHCPRCGTTNEPGSVYCYQCGLPLEEETRSSYGPATDPQPMRVRLYQSPQTRANWTVALLIVTCVVYGLHMLVTFGVLDMVSRQEAGQFVSQVELDDIVQGLDGMTILLFFVYIPTVVSFLMWLHRASRNLQSLGSYNQRFSPGWAVGWWFIPIMWFFRPYQVVAEVWRGSNPNAPLDVDWKRGAVSALLGWWWGLWIVQNLSPFVGGYSFGFAGSFDLDLTPSSGALQLDLLSSALAILAGVLAILVVLQITRRQEEKHIRVAAG